VRDLLHGTFPLGEWSITRPEHGQQKECFIARSQDETVFVKFEGAPAAIVRRLGELGCAPLLLAGGEIDGRPYVIQEYVTGTHPSGWRWYGEHLPLLAESTRRYQQDMELRRLLVTHALGSDYHAHIADDLADLERQLSELSLDEPLADDLSAALAELRRQASGLQRVELVPVHGDPNGLNIILTQGRLILVDWDDIRLSDPVQDIAQWLCWYVAQAQWPSFCAHYGWEIDRPLIDRLFWWAARASCANALWHLSRHYSYQVFVRDCWDALRQQMAPHQVFAGT
jgi:aminoglycoside phosphotransferase (APT) family kinase protein